jgi:hypothetical protein
VFEKKESVGAFSGDHLFVDFALFFPRFAVGDCVISETENDDIQHGSSLPAD